MFERKTMEQILADMIKWTRGTNARLTDFRVGSQARTLYEAVAVSIEENYDRVYRAMKRLIEENIYAVIGFDKEPATNASGVVRMSRLTPAADNLYIRSGTVVLSRATQYHAPIKYYTTEDALLQVGHTFVDVPVVAQTAGEDGNAPAGDLVDFSQKPVGVDTVTNLEPIDGGRPEETKEAQKSRFQAFIEANARGILQSIEYGATLAEVVEPDGTVSEAVQQARALEFLPERRGEVDVYIWNGTGVASDALIEDVRAVVFGAYTEDGRPVYGYKAAGVLLNVYSAPLRSVSLKVDLTPDEWSTSEELEARAEQTIDLYFSNMRMGAELIQTDLEARIKVLEGVRDVKLAISTDGGVTYTADNVVPEEYEVVVAEKPVVYGG